jgi:hypothetical protein
MKNRLANITAAIRGSRKAKVAMIIGAVWVALLVGFVGGSRVTAKTQKVSTLNPRPSAARSPHKHRRAPGNTTLPHTSASIRTVPCPAVPITSQERPSGSQGSSTPTEDQTRNDQTRNTLPRDPSEDQDHQDQGRSRATAPVAPYPGTNQARTVVWISVPVSPYKRRVQTRVVPVEGITVFHLLAAQGRSEPGFRAFRRQVETGTSEPGFKSFRR